MVSFGDLLNPEQVAKLANDTVEIGSVYIINLGEENGIHPTPGYDTRRKFFIVLGYDAGTLYGGVVINSNINTNIKGQIIAQHLPIHASTYPFLQYDSFVDCLELKIVKVETFNTWKYQGKIGKSDISQIIQTICASPIESKIRLRKFGLIK